jgi:hypothetical protein
MLAGKLYQALAKRRAPERTVTSACLRPGPDVRERRLFGEPKASGRFQERNRKRQNPQSTHSRVSTSTIQRSEADVGSHLRADT